MSIEKKSLPSLEYLYETLNYNPDSGDLLGSIKYNKSGQPRVDCVINYVNYFAHRLIFKLVNGD